MVKIFIDPGHGGKDSGASGYGLYEKDLTLSIATSIRKSLEDYEGVTVKMSRTSDQTVSLTERTKSANHWDADLFLSIHINAGGGTGFESYIYKELSNSSRSAKRRAQIHDQVMKVNELKDRGKKKANFHVLRESIMSAVLTENGFIDTKEDAKKLKSKAYLNKVGKAHVEGIADIFNLRKGASEPTTSSDKYTVKTDIGGYFTAHDAKKGIHRKTTVRQGKYDVYKRAQGMINVTKEKNIPGSWINPADNNDAAWRVGQKVKVDSDAKKYATGETIPDWVKGRTYTIQQIKDDEVLLKEIYSWVKKSDITR